MKQISAWIRDPANNWIKGMSKHAALYRLFCENPEACDLFVRENTCLNCGVMSSCKFGRKIGTEGPTRQARSFYTTVQKWKEENAEYISKLNSLTAYNRIFRTNGYFYLPYAFMTGSFGSGCPLDSKWVAEADLTTELLSKICAALPRAMFGGVINDYQNKEIPKFISDLHMHYPEIFALLPEEQKSRLATINYVGRKADLTTCAPGKYLFSKSTWEWDGEVLRGRSMLFQPVAGDLSITIKPKTGEAVTITSNDQVTANTRFLD